VAAAHKTGEFLILSMAGQALLVVLFFCLCLEGDDFRLVPVILGVRLARPMTGFARVAEIKFRALLKNYMRIFVKCLDQIIMTDGTIFVFDAPAFRRFHFFRGILSRKPDRAAGQNPH
jgi:hypothetical protein